MISQKWFCRMAWFRGWWKGYTIYENTLITHEIQDAEDAEREERDVVGD
jgi:hypothetical protein